MSNKDVIQAFLDKVPAKCLNMHSTGDRLFSYSTCIAEWDKFSDYKLYINLTKYSVSTSKHQTYLIRSIGSIRAIEVDDVPRETQNLI